MKQRLFVKRGLRWFNLVAGLILFLAGPCAALAQDGDLEVMIDRPGEGESYYTGAGGPRTLVPIVGRVLGGSFDPTQIELQLEVLQDGRPLGSEEGEPDANGAFTFRVMSNVDGSPELGTPESNCFSCHEAAKLALPAGAATLRITAIEPTGRQVTTERHVSLDRAGLAKVTVKVTMPGDAGRMVAAMPVAATTNLYGWRSRKFTALADMHGQATLYVEALSLQPTRYQLTVAPLLVDGILYQAAAPIEFVLPPGATSLGPLSLPAEARLGQLTGTVGTTSGQPIDETPVTVRAVELPYGRSFSAPVAAGQFAFAGLPIGRYLLAADAGGPGGQSFQPRPATADFGQGTTATCALQLEPATGRRLRGTLHDLSGEPLPFGWVALPGGSLTTPVTPVTGSFELLSVSSGIRTLQAGAPGHWSRLVPARAGAPLAVRLDPRPGTQRLPWGKGSLVIPEDTRASAAGSQITLERGWLWGAGDGVLTIRAGETDITVREGRFAIEYLPGESAWLYLPKGQAEVRRSDGASTVMRAGQMLAFAGKDIASLLPAVLDEAGLRLLLSQRPAAANSTFRPGLLTRVEDALAAVGIMDPTPLGAAACLLAAATLAGALFAGARTWRRGARGGPGADGAAPEEP